MPPHCHSGSCVNVVMGGFTDPLQWKEDPNSNIYISDSGNSSVREIPKGLSITVVHANDRWRILATVRPSLWGHSQGHLVERRSWLTAKYGSIAREVRFSGPPLSDSSKSSGAASSI